MKIISMVIILFIILETANIIILYFKPDSPLGNGVAVFNGWEKSKEDKDIHEFVKYLVYWVAGTKLIFIFLLIVILFTGTEVTKILTLIALIISIASYYWRLHPIMKMLDNKGEISPKGYSKTLGVMIGSFIGVFLLALLPQIIKFK